MTAEQRMERLNRLIAASMPSGVEHTNTNLITVDTDNA